MMMNFWVCFGGTKKFCSRQTFGEYNVRAHEFHRVLCDVVRLCNEPYWST